MAVFVWLILWFDNAQGITSNGVFKAVTIKAWVADPANASLETSNYLYYPVMALLCRLLDVIGVYPGDPRHQLTIINAFSAALCLCIVYLLVRQITGRRSVAWAATAFHLSGAFFLNLAIINEDIMPSYTLMFASMALASVWFVRSDGAAGRARAALFTIAWMFEWRLMFPTLPAMLLALAVGPGRPLDKARAGSPSSSARWSAWPRSRCGCGGRKTAIRARSQPAVDRQGHRQRAGPASPCVKVELLWAGMPSISPAAPMLATRPP